MRFSFTSTMLRAAFFLPLMTFLLASCAVGPNYHTPSVTSPDAFRDAPSAASTNSLADLPWWSVFKDQILQNLIQTALTNNYDLRIAISRVEQARYLQRQAQSVFLPQVGYVGEADRGKNVVLGLPTPNSGTLNSYVGAFDVLWEIDLWGRIRRLNEAARARLLASREAQEGIRLTLVSEIATALYPITGTRRKTGDCATHRGIVRAHLQAVRRSARKRFRLQTRTFPSVRGAPFRFSDNP